MSVNTDELSLRRNGIRTALNLFRSRLRIEVADIGFSNRGGKRFAESARHHRHNTLKRESQTRNTAQTKTGRRKGLICGSFSQPEHNRVNSRLALKRQDRHAELAISCPVVITFAAIGVKSSLRRLWPQCYGKIRQRIWSRRAQPRNVQRFGQGFVENFDLMQKMFWIDRPPTDENGRITFRRGP